VTPAPSRRSVLSHLAVLVLALLAVSPLLELDVVFSADEGSNALQARVLREGGWDAGYAFREADPSGRFVPWHAASVTDAAVVPYAQHPLWSRALHVSTGIAGEQLGLRILSVLALVAVAALGWALAGELGGRRAGPWGFWMAAASPVLANAWGVWAHAPSAALGGTAALGLLRVERSRIWIAPVLLATTVGIALRSEALLWSLALAASVAILGRGRSRWLGLAVAAVSGATLLLERAWVRSIVPGTAVQSSIVGPSAPVVQDRAPGAGVPSRLSGLRTAVIDNAFGAEDVRLLGYVTLATMVLVVLVVMRRGSGRVVALSVAVVALVSAGRLVMALDEPVPGLLAAAPILILGLAWRPEVDQRWILGAVPLFVGAVAASIYTDGGGLQWGGRFLSPMVPLLAAAAAVAVARLLDALPVVEGRPVAVAAALLLGVQAAGAVMGPDRVREQSEAMLQEVRSLDQAVVLAGTRHLGRFDVDRWPDACWLAMEGPPNLEVLEDLVDVLRRSGIGQAAFIGIEPSMLEEAGASVGVRLGDDLGVVWIEDSAADRSISAPYRC
jgi:hypothetical protein